MAGVDAGLDALQMAVEQVDQVPLGRGAGDDVDDQVRECRPVGDHEVETLTGGEHCLAALKADVRWLAGHCVIR